ncbi:hypothetical protein [Brevundimonas sp.]|uniref:hypothetical protein n=1 Tax=Brevundimonas sp. TaxID=1871086 RepID=UPI002FC7A00E
MSQEAAAGFLAAHWTEQAVYPAWVAVFVNAIGLWFVFRQIQQNSRAIAAATEATRVAVAETRPWLELTLTGPTFSFRDDDPHQGTSVAVTATMTNVGKTPAIDAVLSVEVIPDVSKTTVEEALNSPRPLSLQRATLFPDRSAAYHQRLLLGPREQKDVWYILAIATYRVPGGDELMRTPTVFLVSLGDPMEPNHSDPDSYEYRVFDGYAQVSPQQHVAPT